MGNLIIIPTNKPSQLFSYNERPDKLFLDLDRDRIPVTVVEHQNIYVTNDDEIKINDYVKTRFGVGRVKEFVQKYGYKKPCYLVEDVILVIRTRKEKETHSLNYDDCKKIVFTTDKDLIKNGVQAISDEFLRWFVKNPTCNDVKVKKSWFGTSASLDETYEIVFPKDETEFLLSTDANKERLLEAAEKLKGKELFKESNDRARKTLSEIESLPIVESPQRESFENKALKWWMGLSTEEQVEIGFKYDEPTFNLTLRAIMFEFEQYEKKH